MWEMVAWYLWNESEEAEERARKAQRRIRALEAELASKKEGGEANGR